MNSGVDIYPEPPNWLYETISTDSSSIESSNQLDPSLRLFSNSKIRRALLFSNPIDISFSLWRFRSGVSKFCCRLFRSTEESTFAKYFEKLIDKLKKHTINLSLTEFISQYVLNHTSLTSEECMHVITTFQALYENSTMASLKIARLRDYVSSSLSLLVSLEEEVFSINYSSQIFSPPTANSSLECSSQWSQCYHVNGICTQMRQPIHYFDMIHIFAYRLFVVSTHLIIPLLLHSFSFFFLRRSDWEIMYAPVSLHVPYWCEIIFPPTYITFLKERDNAMSNSSLITSGRSTVTD